MGSCFVMGTPVRTLMSLGSALDRFKAVLVVDLELGELLEVEWSMVDISQWRTRDVGSRLFYEQNRFRRKLGKRNVILSFMDRWASVVNAYLMASRFLGGYHDCTGSLCLLHFGWRGAMDANDFMGSSPLAYTTYVLLASSFVESERVRLPRLFLGS
jgi:hypothetical protein